ncbi:MAG: hypothetical protein LH618_20880 [Saprospiraceae bacterium]|nr:hypothetical protein [Saprospiraceae bacterium]
MLDLPFVLREPELTCFLSPSGKWGCLGRSFFTAKGQHLKLGFQTLPPAEKDLIPMFFRNTSGEIRGSYVMADVFYGTRFGWIASAASRSNATNLSAWVSAVRLLAILLAAIYCVLFSNSTYAGILLVNALDPRQDAEPGAIVLTALGYAVPELGFFEIGRLSYESGCGTSQKVEQRQAKPSALPTERPIPFQTPMSSQLALASSGQTLIGANNSRTGGGGGVSAGLLNETRSVLKPLRSEELLVREFQYLPDAALFELFRPS